MSYHSRFATSLLLVLVVHRVATVSASAEDAQRAQDRPYAGLTVSEWHERLKNIPPTSPSAVAIVGPLIEIVGDDSLRGVDREPFAAFLARVGTPARRVVPILASLIERRKESGSDYLWAARALALMGEPAKEATPELIDLVFDERIPVGNRQSPVEALARIGPAHPDAIPALLRLLQYRATNAVNEADAALMRRLAAESLFLVGPDAEVAAPLLIRMVRNRKESEAARRNAIIALGALKSRGAIAVAALSEELINGRAPAPRDEAAKALVSIGVDAIPTMMRLLEHPDPEVRWRVALSLGGLEDRRAAAGVQRKLTQLLEDRDAQVRISAAESCQKLYGPSDQLILATIELLASQTRDVRIRAKRLLLELRPLEDKHLTALKNLRDRSSGNAAKSVTATLKQLDRRRSGSR